MRFLSIPGLTALALLCAASTASAFAFHMSPRNATTGLQPGDTVTIDVFFDADQVGLLLFSEGMIYQDNTIQYLGTASTQLPIIYPAPPESAGTNGQRPAYILYAPGGGMAPPTYMVPHATPFLKWNGVPSGPGLGQMNIDIYENNVTDTFNTMVTGSNLWIASVVLQVKPTAPDGDSTIQLCNDCNGNVLSIGLTPVPPGDITTTGATTITVPEPASVGLGMAALASLSFYAVRLRRRRNA